MSLLPSNIAKKRPLALLLLVVAAMGIGLCLVAAVLVWLDSSASAERAVAAQQRVILPLSSVGQLEKKAANASDFIAESEPQPAINAPVNNPVDVQVGGASLPQEQSPSPKEDAIAAVPPRPVEVAVKTDIGEGVYKRTPDGLLPIISKAGQEPWQYYAKPSNIKAGTPVIAVVITGLGNDATYTDMAKTLPEYVTLSFSPYADKLDKQVLAARRYGYETWLDLPVQAKNYPLSDRGMLSLLVEQKPKQLIAMLNALLTTTPMISGVVSMDNDGFSSHIAQSAVIATALRERGLLWLLRESVKLGNPTRLLVATKTISLEQAGGILQARGHLRELVQTAKKYQYAIGVVDPSTASLDLTRAWIATLEKEGVTLVPLSAIVTHSYKE